MKPKAIIVCFVGELYWEIARFAPYVKYKKRTSLEDVVFIVMSRLDRIDIYSDVADIFVPLRLDETNMIQDCFKLVNYPEKDYYNLIRQLENQFSDRYQIIEKIYPNISDKNYSHKNQFSRFGKMEYSYFPRKENKELIDEKIITNKKIVAIAPRYRKGLKRNWIYWKQFYDLLYENKNLMNKFEFIICGKNPDCVPDEKDRFIDINKFSIDKNTSLIGLTIEILKKSVLTVGSQSCIPNISLLLGIPVLSWGDQKRQHEIDYNLFKTEIKFLEDKDYNIRPEIIINNTEKILKNKGD
jgi:hypothetical protein